MTTDSNAAPRKTPVEASQGTTRPKLIYVLIGGLALVLAMFALVWMMQGSH